MLFLLSPAKTLDFSPAPENLSSTRPAMAKDIAALARIARNLKAADLKRLMGISDKLAELNVARFKAFDPQPDAALDNAVPAALAFAGDVYTGLKARELDAESLTWAQGRVRILSGLYGLLRPLDAIQPYRLEMGVKLANPRGDTLYDFWGDRIAKAINADAEGHADPTVINLASQEYFGAVDRKALKRPVVTCIFKQEVGAELTHPSFYAKTARGLMARFAIDTQAERLADLMRFDRAGYRFRSELSFETELVFTRPHP